MIHAIHIASIRPRPCGAFLQMQCGTYFNDDLIYLAKEAKDMSMTTCRKCGSEVKRVEKKCPYCEASNPSLRWWRPVLYLFVFIALIKVCSYIPEPDPANQREKDTTLRKWRSLDKEERLTFIDSFLSQEKIAASDASGFYKCMSQYSIRKMMTSKLMRHLVGAGWIIFRTQPLSTRWLTLIDSLKTPESLIALTSQLPGI